ncbi:hypothetical protein BG004_007289 [Podila humilis]|nr:hypothetical protein BG004_007289 [Podila humilis]
MFGDLRSTSSTSPATPKKRSRKKSPSSPSSKLQPSSLIWTPEMDAKIVEMRLDGNSWKEIGAAIHRDPPACLQRYARELDPVRKQVWSPEKLEDLCQMVKQGKSWKSISEKLMIIPAVCREKWIETNPELAEELKIRRQVAQKVARGLRNMAAGGAGGANAYGRHTNAGSFLVKRHRWTEDMDAVLLDLKDRGFTWRQIGAVLGMTPMTAHARYIYKLKPLIQTGWTPLPESLAKVPYYLLHDRTPPQPHSSNNNTSDSNHHQHSEQSTATTTIPPHPFWLNAIGEDYSYNQEPYTYTQRTWTEEEDKVLLESRQEGWGFGAIGRKMRLDPRACHHRYFTALDEGSKKEWTSYHSDRLLFYIKHGLSWSTICYALGFHKVICMDKWAALSRRQHPPTLPQDPIVDHNNNNNSNNNNSTKPAVFGNQGNSGYRAGAGAKEDDDDSPFKDAYGTLMDRDLDDQDLYDDDDEEFALEDTNNREEGGDVIDELGGGYKDDSQGDHAAEEYVGTDDGDMLDATDTDDAEGVDFGATQLATGRSSKKKLAQKLAMLSSSSRSRSIWDEDTYLREVQKSWTTNQENALIQHVIRQGTKNWDAIAQALGGTHSADECRAYWKFLDMPVTRRPVTKDAKWDALKEAQFWRLWLETGSNFEEIAKRLSNNPLLSRINNIHYNNKTGDPMGPSEDFQLTAEDCMQLFEKRTHGLIQNLDKDIHQQQQKQKQEEEKEKEGADLRQSHPNPEKTFQEACVQLALTRTKPPTFTWDKEKSVKLQKLVRQRLKTRGVQVNWINWKWVARHVGGGATSQRCNVHWRWLRKMDREDQTTTTTSWTEQDTQILEQAVREIGPVFHHDISKENIAIENEYSTASNGPTLAGLKTIQRFYLPEHPVDLIQKKYFLLSDKASQVTVDEYMAIMEAVDIYGDDQWDKVAERIGTVSADEKSSMTTTTTKTTTTPTSSTTTTATTTAATTAWTKAPCRRVWEASYKHTLQHTPWTTQEDQDLKESVGQLGPNNWTSIARFFPGKSAWQCQLRWCSLVDPIDPRQA